MTREHKLALIIGFSLILFVGILISDHLSKAGAGVYERVSDGTARLAEGVGSLDSGLAPGRLPERQAPYLPAPALAQQEADGGRAVEVGESDPASLAQAEVIGRTLVDGGWKLLEQMVSGMTQPSPPPALEIEQSRGAAAPGAALPDEPYVTHVVREGESLYRIAAEYYGAGAQWPRISQANPQRVGEDGTVRKGVTLRIPGVAPRAQAPSPTPSPAPSAERGQVRRYTVRKNDTLGEIAQELLGSARRRSEIVALNQDKIRNENEIRAGMILKIPAG
ncbi:MAG: LysM peptidoglycan-binding domain-containing protein [Phycisphaerales bacterium JB039]